MIYFYITFKKRLSALQGHLKTKASVIFLSCLSFVTASLFSSVLSCLLINSSVSPVFTYRQLH